MYFIFECDCDTPQASHGDGYRVQCVDRYGAVNIAMTLEQRFRDTIVSDLAELKVSTKNIVDHLLRLNGEVVSTKGELERLKLAEARRLEGDERSSTRDRIIWGIVGGVAMIVLQHLPTLLGPFIK